MAIGMDEADFGEDEDEALEPISGKVQIVIKGAPSQPYVLDILASLLMGGATEGGEQLVQRLKRWQGTTASQGSQVYSESPDEGQSERVRYAVIGLLAHAPDLAQGALSTAMDAAGSAYDRCSKWLSPVTHSRPMQPVLRRYNSLAAHGATVVERWIDRGRAAEQRSRALVREAAFDGEDELIEHVVGKLAQEPALRNLISQQGVGMAGELMGALRILTARADMRLERRVRAIFRRR